MELFDYLKAMTEKKEELDFDNDEVRKGYSSYLINRFVSMCEIYIPLCNEINRYDVPKSVHFRYMSSVLPKRKQFFKYIKKKKDLSQTEKLVIANYFQIGLKETEQYINILDENQLKEIIDIFKFGKNSIAGV